MQRKNGFLQIKDYQLIRNCNALDGKYCVSWINIEGVDYLYKEYKSIKICYKEVFWTYVLKELGIPNVGYDLASDRGNFGVITKNAKKEGQLIKSLLDLIIDYQYKGDLEARHSSISDLFNVKSLEKVFAFHYKDKLTPSERKALNRSLLEQFIIQILSGNCDLHERNISMIEEPQICFFPYFDFGRYNVTNFKITNCHTFCLGYQKVSYMESPKEILKKFLDYGTKEELELLRFYIEQFCTLNTLKIYEQMEEDMSYKIPQNLKRDLSRKLIQNSIYIEKQIR